MPTPSGGRFTASEATIDGLPVALDKVEEAISALPQVLRARVEVEKDKDGADRIVAHVTPARSDEGARELEVEQKRVDEWHSIYEWVYGELPQSGGLGDNFVGWHSSYTELPIPLSEMRQWRDATVTRVLAHRPRRVLEIGVGTGLLMAAIAPSCEQYTATDFSSTVIAKLTEEIAGHPELAERVELRVREANDFTGLPEDHFDLVLINSVVQYFPNTEYLAEVISRAVQLVKPGGAVFAGDIRNLRLLDSFRTAVLGGSTTLLDAGDPEKALEAVRQSSQDERELLIDPDFFSVVQRRSPEAGPLDIRLKRADYHNELSRHRYDAVLYRRPTEAVPLDEGETVVWGSGITGPDELRKVLAERGPRVLRVASVPNSRVRHETTAARLLAALAPTEEVSCHLAQAADNGGVDPEEFHALAAELGYRTAVTWARSGEPDEIDVAFTRDEGSDPLGPVFPYTPSGSVELPLAEYGNNPAHRAAASGYTAALRAALAAELPGHLMPSAFVIE
jgi:SAM-dependent methyltransferase